MQTFGKSIHTKSRIKSSNIRLSPINKNLNLNCQILIIHSIIRKNSNVLQTFNKVAYIESSISPENSSDIGSSVQSCLGARAISDVKGHEIDSGKTIIN